MNKRALFILMGSLASLGGCGTHTSIGELGNGGQGGTANGGNGGAGGTGGAANGGTGGAGGAGGQGGQGGGVIGPDGGTQPAGMVSFQAAGAYFIGNNGFTFVLGDLSGDAKPDLVVADVYGVSVFVNKGNGMLVGPNNFAFPGYRPALGDMNGDGKTDLVMQVSGGVGVLISAGGVALYPPVTYAASVGTFALGDLNGDGKTDIVATDGQDPGQITLLSNTGGGTFASTVLPLMSGAGPIALADVNGDSKGDVAFLETVANGSRLTVLVSAGNGTFKPATSYGIGTYAATLALGDLNGDGKIDAVLGNGATLNPDVLLNYGDGTFTAAVDYPTGTGGPDPTNPGAISAFAIGDLNGDGKAEIAFASARSGVGYLLNKGDGTFGPATTLPLDGFLYSPPQIALADLDGDGKLDIAVSTMDRVLVYLNTSH